MRLLIVGTLEGHITTAGQIAMQRGAKVSHIPDFEGGLRILRNGPGADLVMIDVRQPVARFMKQMKQERMNTPVVARSEEHTSELQSLMRISYAVFCLK